MDNTTLEAALKEHNKQKEMLACSPGILRSIKNSRDAYEMADTISNGGPVFSCAIIDSLNPETQLFMYWILQQRAGREDDLYSKIAALIISRAEKLKLPIVQAFSVLCEEIPALKAKAFAS